MNPKKGKGPKPRVICFGEVLWDSLPAGLFLGGAPLNVAAHLALLGADPAIVSCVGTDYLGDEAIRRARDMGVDTRFVALDTELPTGTVAARLDARGNATYSFGERVAWDQIPTAAGLEEAVAGAQALVFGTLALRKPANRELLERLLPIPGPLKVFDINLRAPHYDTQYTLDLARRVDLLKCNVEEAREIGGLENCEDIDLAAELSQNCGVERVCVTLGERGAIYRWPGGTDLAPAPRMRIRDTVGAGDALLAALLFGILTGREDETGLLGRCCRLAAFVASCDGAVPFYVPGRFGF